MLLLVSVFHHHFGFPVKSSHHFDSIPFNTGGEIWLECLFFLKASVDCLE